MTSSNFGQQPPDNPEDSGPRQGSRRIVESFNFPRRIKEMLRRKIEVEAKRQVKEEIEQIIIKEIEQKAKEKIEEKITQEIKELLEAKAEPKVLEALSKFNIDEKLSSIVNNFIENDINKARNKIDQQIKAAENEIKTATTKNMDLLNENTKKFRKDLEVKSKELNKQVADFRKNLEAKKQKFETDVKTKNKELGEQVTDFHKGLEAKKQELDDQVTDFHKGLEAKKQELDEKMTDQINKAQKISKIYKTIEPELLKIRTLVILTPAILIAFGVFFGDRIKDIMSIDVLEKEVELLRDDIRETLENLESGPHRILTPLSQQSFQKAGTGAEEVFQRFLKSLQPQQGQGSYQPWEGGHCPYGGIFPDCYHTPVN